MVLVPPVQPSVSLGAHFNLVSLARLGAKWGQRAHLLRLLQDRPGPCATEGTQSWEARSLSRNFPARPAPACVSASRALCVSGGSPHAFLLSPLSFSDCTAVLATLPACLFVPVLPSLFLSFNSCPRSFFSVSWFHGLSPSLPLFSPLWALCFSVTPSLSTSLSSSLILFVSGPFSPHLPLSAHGGLS